MGDYNLDVEMLKEICPIYNETIQDQEDRYSNTVYNISNTDAELIQLKDEYMARVEYGNAYIEKLIKAEKEYITSKYGPEIYDYLKNKRDAFTQSKNHEQCVTTIYNNSGITNEMINNSNDISFIIPNLQIDLSNEYQLFEKIKDKDPSIITNLKNNTSIMNKSLQDLYSKNSTNQRKIQYRQEELSTITKYNTYLSYFYFIFIMVYFTVLIIQGNLNLNKYWLFYIILIIFPVYIYPFIFYYLKKLLGFLSLNMEFHGPKNAFLNKQIDLNFIDNHDI